ncbi:MAG: hypothetical protein J6V90_08695 [Treponema sp.]|nr:hypothetical protein [Treponema sp.]
MGIYFKKILKFGATALLFLMSLMAVACNNSSDTPFIPFIPSSKGGKVVESKLIQRDSFNDIIAAQQKAGNTAAVQELKQKKQKYLENFKKSMKKKVAKKNVVLKSKASNTPNKILTNESEVDAFFNSFGIDELCPWVATYTLKYTTTSASGEPITASTRALVNYGEVWPFTWYAETDIVLLHCHATQMQNSAIPTSQSGSGATECGLLYFEAWNDVMVISPDYEGYGATKDRVHPYLIQDVTAQQCYDAARAAYNWKQGEDGDGNDLNGFEDDFYTVAAGYSQGGSVALAVQRYIQNNDSGNVLRLKGSLCGDGPYDPFATYSKYADDNYQMYLPSVIILILRAYLYYYKDSYLKGFTVEDYLKPEIIQALKDNAPDGKGNVWGMVDSKTKSTSDVDGVLKKAAGKEGESYISVSDVITAKAMDEKSDAYKALKAALDTNNLTDKSTWNGGKNDKITAAMHWQGDDAVPYKNRESLNNNLTVKDKGWSKDATDVIQTLANFLSLMGISDSLDDVKTLIEDDPYVRSGNHVAAGKLFFLGNISCRMDYKSLD